MRHAISVLCAALALSLTACKSTPHTEQRTIVDAGDAHANAQPTGGNFDYYLLNLSWSPEFCQSHPDAAECATHAAFVLHGLWPQNNDGTDPERCSNAPGPADPAAYKDIYPDTGLLEHEWKTHGMCSGLSADAFFATARAAYRSVAIPPRLSALSSQTSMPPEDILDLFTQSNSGIARQSLALRCGNNYLTAVEVCLDKSLHPIPCPNVRSCRARTVKIPSP